ncbi:unnamed protein product [Urochloa humidicola]
MEVPVDMEEEGEIIPAATYVPFKDSADDSEDNSDEYGRQVQNFLGSEAESSRANEQAWLARCEWRVDESTKVDNEINLDRSVKITEVDEDNNTHPRDSELDVEKLINPCEMLKQQREERRWSSRVQMMVDDKLMNKQLEEGRKATAGLYGADLKEMIQEGVKVLIFCAQKALMQNRRRPTIRMLPAAGADQEMEEAPVDAAEPEA